MISKGQFKTNIKNSLKSRNHRWKQTENLSTVWFQGKVVPEERTALKVKEPHVSSAVFRLFLGGEDTCTLDPLQLHTLTSCGFNSSNPLIIITHGWSVRSTPAFFTLRWPEPPNRKYGTWPQRGNMFRRHTEKWWNHIAFVFFCFFLLFFFYLNSRILPC